MKADSFFSSYFTRRQKHEPKKASASVRRLVFHQQVFFKKFANCRLALTIERLPKLLISYPDLFLTKQALLIRDLGHHTTSHRNFIRPNLFLDSSRSCPKLDRAIIQHSTVTKLLFSDCLTSLTVRLSEPGHLKEDYPITTFFENKRFSGFFFANGPIKFKVNYATVETTNLTSQATALKFIDWG